MAEFGQLDIYGNLNIKDNLFVRNNIIQDDILYPSFSIVLTNDTASIEVSVLKKDKTLTTSARHVNFSTSDTPYYKLMSARPLIHWWIGTADYGAPALVSGLGVAINVYSGSMLDPTNSPNTAIVRTSLTNNNHKFILKVQTETIATRYFMCSVQGIVYSQAFTTT
jgi:hypothetical protein